MTLRVASEKLIAEEAPESYKDVSQVGQPAATVETETTASCARIRSQSCL